MSSRLCSPYLFQGELKRLKMDVSSYCRVCQICLSVDSSKIRDQVRTSGGGLSFSLFLAFPRLNFNFITLICTCKIPPFPGLWASLWPAAVVQSQFSTHYGPPNTFLPSVWFPALWYGGFPHWLHLHRGWQFWSRWSVFILFFLEAVCRL